jgi:hypothetical protein
VQIVIRRAIPLTIFVSVFFLAVSVSWAADGDNIFEFAYGNAETDTLSDNLIRGVASGSDLDQDDLYEIIVTDYDSGGMVHVYEVTGDNTLEWVWSSAGSNVGNVRQVGTGDLDNDGIGEIIFVGCDGTWSAEYEGGIHVYEWDGSTDNGYGTVPLSIYKPNPTNQEYFRSEGFAVGDVDQDGVNEMVVCDNTITADQDGLYILSVTGDFTNPFHTWNEEGVWLRTGTYPFGGSPTNAQIGDMDGDGNYEAIFGVWDYAALYIVEATGADAYVYQTYISIDTTGDGVNLDNFEVADLDEDGADEVYFNIYGGGEMAVVTGGTDVSTITFENNVTYLAHTGEAGAYGMALGDQDHGPGTDGMDIYTAKYTNGVILDHELTGADPTNPANWTVDTLFAGTSNDQGSFGLSAPPVDLDNDGKLELVATFLEAVPPEGKWFRVFEWTGETGVEEYTIAVDVPREFALAQNYPNPFNANTTIEYTISRPTHVSLKIFNATGQLVTTLVNDYRPINRYAVTWDGTDEGGRPVASGVYFCQLVAGKYNQTRKMTLLK